MAAGPTSAARRDTGLNRKVGVAQAEAARAQPKAAKDVASTTAAKDCELLEEAYRLATAEESWVMASAHPQAATVPVRKTHGQNLSRDNTATGELRHACVTTGHAKSGFGAVDYFNFHTSPSMTAGIGAAHTNRVHLLQTPGEMAAKARKVIMTERRIGGKGPEEDAGALVDKWKFTSFRSLPREGSS